MKKRSLFSWCPNLILLCLVCNLACVRSAAESVGDPIRLLPENPRFEARSSEALRVMQEKAGQLHVGGVAVIAYFEGPGLRSWTSRMLVVDRYKDAPSASNAGANLLAIAYAKAAEMADSLKDSGHAGRPVMTGEFGWQGGLVRAWNGGYLIAAFSGGKSEDDVEVSKAGILAMTATN